MESDDVAGEITVCDESKPLVAVSMNDPVYQEGSIKIDINLSGHLCSHYAEQLSTKKHTDVTFCIDTNKVTAHRIILATQSEYFDSLLYGSMRESKENSEIELKDVSLSSFQLLLHYAYTGRVELNGAKLQGVLELMETADRFSFLALKDALASQLSSLINVSTVLPIYLSTHRLELKQLQESCLTFSDKNAAAILQENALLTLPEDALSEILQRDTFLAEEMSIYRTVLLWMQENNVTRSGLLKCVRLSEIPSQLLVDLSELRGCFNETEVLSALRIRLNDNWQEMRPRGRIEMNKNLVDYEECAHLKSVVSFDRNPYSTEQFGSFGTSRNQASQIGSRSYRNQVFTDQFDSPQTKIGTISFVSQSDVVYNVLSRDSSNKKNQSRALSSVLINFNLSHKPNTVKEVHLFESTLNTAIIAFNDTYLINQIIIDPQERNESLGFSYTLEISRDSTHWITIIDYTGYNCYGEQVIQLSTIAIGFLRFKLVSVNNTNKTFKMKLIDCKFVNFEKKFSQRKNGILAPRDFMNASVNQKWYTDNSCTVRIRQPFIIKTLKFKLDIDCSVETVGDILISCNEEKKELTLINVILKGSENEFELPEEIILTGFTLKIINLVNVQTPITSLVTFKISDLMIKSETK